MKIAVRKKLLYKKFLDTGTNEAERQYNQAKTEAKRVVLTDRSQFVAHKMMSRAFNE